MGSRIPRSRFFPTMSPSKDPFETSRIPACFFLFQRSSILVFDNAHLLQQVILILILMLTSFKFSIFFFLIFDFHNAHLFKQVILEHNFHFFSFQFSIFNFHNGHLFKQVILREQVSFRMFASTVVSLQHLHSNTSRT